MRSRLRRYRGRVIAAVAVAVTVPIIIATTTGGSGCTTTLSAGANVATAITGAPAGATICLNDGSYGALSIPTFTKSPAVTVKAVNLHGASFGAITTNVAPNGLVLDGLNVTANGSFDTANTARNVTIKNVEWNTFQLAIFTNQYNNQSITIGPGNHWGAFDDQGQQEGRLSVVFPGGPGANPSGVTVTGNTFGPGGCSDGINLGSNAVQVLNNTFSGIAQGSCVTHTDAVQGYGDINTTLDGNYWSGSTVCFGWYDNGTGLTATDNVCSGANSVASFRGLTNPTIEHNTFDGSAFRISEKSGTTAPSGYTIRNNLFHSWGLVDTTACTGCTMTSNMFDTGAFGSANVTGSPTYTGGTTPSTYAGFQLTAGSTGHAAASDGLDMGARF